MTRVSREVANRAAAMQRIIKATIIALVLALSAPVAAQDFDAGFEAYHRGDYAAALRWYRMAAEQGDYRGQTNLGFMYENGLGVPQDYTEAMTWYRKAAEQGTARAQTNIGVMYHRGKGVTQDYDEAIKWFRKAAEQGDALAQANLASMYGLGRGVPQDYIWAYIWFSLAAIQGEEGATKGRELVSGNLTSWQISEADKLVRAWTPFLRSLGIGQWP